MSGCDAQTFSGITQEHFDRLAQKAQSALAITISGDAGSASRDGITIAWDYDRASQTLTIQCTEKPFFPTCGMIASQIQSLVDGCLRS
jgi:hypothetical protein